MKLKDLAPVLRSTFGNIQFAIVYDETTLSDIADGCSVDYAVKHYPDLTLDRITAYGNYLILHTHGKED